MSPPGSTTKRTSPPRGQSSAGEGHTLDRRWHSPGRRSAAAEQLGEKAARGALGLRVARAAVSGGRQPAPGDVLAAAGPGDLPQVLHRTTLH